MTESSIDQTERTPPDTFLGRSIGDNDRYYIEECLGRGGMGSVYRAIDRKLGKKVAIKRFNTALDPEITSIGVDFRNRFERECVICAALTNENVVQVSDYGITLDDEPFYVMEYLDGKTLEQLLEQETQLSIEQTKEIIIQVCHGLQSAHEGVSFKTADMAAEQQIKIVHRDLKPSNIFLVPTMAQERVKIIDFGVAKIQPLEADNPNVTNVFLGTYHYAAPEQLDCQETLDERSDIYCLGLILYEMLTGVDPFGLGERGQQITGEAWIKAHLMKSVQPIRSQPGCESVSITLEKIILRCLEKHPDFRFSSVRELAEALEAEQSPDAKPHLVVATKSPTYLARLRSSLPRLQEYLKLIQTFSKARIQSLCRTFSLTLKALKQSEFFHRHRPSRYQGRLNPIATPLTVVNSDLIDQCHAELASYIGPSAHLMIEQTLQETAYHEPQQFIETLATFIPDREAATRFRQTFFQLT